jgi:RHS repeat-associated protein
LLLKLDIRIGLRLHQEFTSYERDIETGLDYAQARYYGNTQGRFTSPDPMLSSGRQAEPQSWNRYAYVVNNPLMFTDPSGLIWGYRDYEQDGKKMREFQWFDGDQAGEGFTNYNHSYFVSQNEVIWLDSGSSAFFQVSKERFSDAEF